VVCAVTEIILGVYLFSTLYPLSLARVKQEVEMMSCKVESIHKPIAVIRPVYSENGDGCEIITDHGESYYDRRSIKSVKKALARAHSLDLKAQSATVARMLGRGGVLPFYLDKGMIYVPFKMRRALASGDYCYGYVRQDQLVDISTRENTPCISLQNGRVLELVSTLAGARLNLEAARRLTILLTPPVDEEERVIQAIKMILEWLKK